MDSGANISQNFHIKAAIVVLQSRVSLPVIITRNGTKKVNKWVNSSLSLHLSLKLICPQFQLETDDTEAYQDDLRVWKTCGGYENRPPVMIIETYLDTSRLTSKQSLVVVDDNGKRWDVAEALNTSAGSNDDRASRQYRPRTEVVLERWRIELIGLPDDAQSDFGAILPTVYKKCIVFFRSLYATTKFVPAWKFAKNLAKSAKSNLRVSCRVITGEAIQSGQNDPLTHPLYDSYSPVTTTYSLGETENPAGRFTAELQYRNDCNFRVDDSEALLSSRFMGADENYFQPSLGTKSDTRKHTSRAVEVGSLPAHRQRADDAEPTQAYGSMSTFHGNAPPLGSSPISALRNARTMGSDTSSPPSASSLRSRPSQNANPSRPLEGINAARRPSLSFQPFKAGSLSSSPVPGTPFSDRHEMLPPQSPHSFSRNYGIGALHQARNRSSLTAGMPASLRGAPVVPDNSVPLSASSSPRPTSTSRYSSSFTHRRSKPSYGGTSKVEDDQGSSGKQSLSSSTQPGSGILAEAGPGGSSGSLQTDDDQITDFLLLLDKNKNRSLSSADQAARTGAQLSRFRSMQESNNILTDSMSASALLHRSSSASSRQLSSVPPMVAATSVSTSSSPGKPISPHTPHTPAIPSRLSANSIAEYSQPRRLSHRSRTTPENRIDDNSGEETPDAGTTNAIDIPTSPRPFYPHTRRSSSVAQQHRALAVDDDVGDLPFGPHRSVSLGDNDREPPTLDSLLGIGQSEAVDNEVSCERILQPPPDLDESPATMARQMEHSEETEESTQLPRGLTPGSNNAPYRPRIGRMGGRGYTPPQGASYASLTGDRGSGSGSALSERPGSRYSFSRPAYAAEDDEPLLFDMSEIGRDQQGRRSLEDARGGGYAGGSVNERGGYDSSRGGDSGSSSRRGSRRGW